MSKFLQEAIRAKKNYLIGELIKLGIYKKGDLHLYELTLTELEEEYKAEEARQMNLTYTKS